VQFKRSNSYIEKLDQIFSLDDHEGIQEQEFDMRKSFKIERKKVNKHFSDETIKR
jgi:hypothetical protein